jgi:predicted RNase H-like nuclease (RuvC/YqgF family)
MGFGEKLAKLANSTGIISIEVEEEKVEQNEKPKIPTQPYIQPQQIVNPLISPTYQPQSNSLDEAFVKFIEAKKPSGIGYFDFQKMKVAMSVIPDTMTRYVASFTSLQVQGLTKDLLIQNSNNIISIIDDEVINFNTAFEKQSNATLGTLNKEISDIDSNLETLRKQIAELEATLNSKKQSLKETQDKMEVKRTQFLTNSNLMKSQIQIEISNIENFIK